MNGYFTVEAVLVVLLVVALLCWRRSAGSVKRLDEMLTAAMEHRFSQMQLDTDRMSAVECRMERYLAQEALSAQNTASESARIGQLIGDFARQTQEPVRELKRGVEQLQGQSLNRLGQDAARTVALQAEKIQSLLAGLEETVRLETGVQALRPQGEKLAPTVARAAAQYAPKAWDKDVALTVGRTEGRAVFDSKWTEEILCKLLDNAVKYTPTGGKIWVETAQEGEFWAVRVSDTGPGIPDRELDKLFDRFYQAPENGEQGVGMGLCLARQIARCQGGDVEAESVLGRGSTFSLLLPREKPVRRSVKH